VSADASSLAKRQKAKGRRQKRQKAEKAEGRRQKAEGKRRKAKELTVYALCLLPYAF
jgi:hypothetical protein